MSSHPRRRPTPVFALAVAAWLLPTTSHAQVTRDQIKNSIRAGANFLRTAGMKSFSGQQSLAALAVLKSGGTKDEPIVKASIAQIRGKIKSGVYRTNADHERIYTAGVEMMVLANADKDLYKAEMEALKNYILGQQASAGFWDYLPPRPQLGDTSMTQYALLGLWAAQRSGLSVPPQAYEKAAGWLLRTQYGNGGFTYRPGDKDHAGGPSNTMTAAGGGNLLIIRMNLYPDGKSPSAKPKQNEPKKFGVLNKVDPTKVEEEKKAAAKAGSRKPTVAIGTLNGKAGAAMRWTVPVFNWDRVTHYQYYYFYAMERFCALAEIKNVGNVDWYQYGATWLLKKQKKDGSWSGDTGDVADTSFAVLFLVRATAKAIGKLPDDLDGGLQIGGKGLDLDNLDALATNADGTVKKRKVTGPLDDLLTALENTQSLEVGEAPKQIVEQIQIGNRDDLLKGGKVDRFVKWTDHPNPEVRRTGVWVLGRTGDVKHVSVIFKALKDDPDADVAVEAHNALCWISRKPLGVGIPNSPYDGLDESLGKDQKVAAINKWRKESIKRWKQWYLKVRPYDERGDFNELKTKEDGILFRRSR